MPSYKKTFSEPLKGLVLLAPKGGGISAGAEVSALYKKGFRVL